MKEETKDKKQLNGLVLNKIIIDEAQFIKQNKYLVFDIETTGLNPYTSQVTCICAKVSDGELFEQVAIPDVIDEVDLIDNFLEFVKVYSNNGYNLVSKNGIGFDIPFLLSRSYVNGLEYSYVKWVLDVPHEDTQLYSFKRVSLQSMCELYGLAGKSLSSGKEAITLFEDGDYETLVSYCANDVVMTEKVYQIYHNLRENK